MIGREFQEFKVTQPMIDRGIAFFVAHPDDFELIGGNSTVSWLRARGVRRIDAIHATVGENGKLYGKSALPWTVARKRREELASAARAGSYNGRILRMPFADGSLVRRQEWLNLRITNLVRREKYGALVSFDREEAPITDTFAHRDHLAIAIATEIASEVSDNSREYKLPWVPVLDYRPELYGWKSKRGIGAWYQYSEVPMTCEDVSEQVRFMGEHHASQFTDFGFLEGLLQRIYGDEQMETFRKLYFRKR